MESETARNIQTYDFSTLYTNLKHDEITIALREVVKIAFKHSNCNFIAIYNKSFAWVKKPRANMFHFDWIVLSFVLDL